MRAIPYHRQVADSTKQPQEDTADDLAVERDVRDNPVPHSRLIGPPAKPVVRIPQCAIPLQSSLLKRIASFHTKEDLLEFVGRYHILLDPINLVTSLYRLAKMSPQKNRATYLTELQRHSTFQLLLRSIGSQFTYGQLQHLKGRGEPKGLDSRCLANLIWALAKLDLSADEGALSSELSALVAPFVVRCVHTSSPQGLANLLWGYSKLPAAPHEVIRALVLRITDELYATLRSNYARPFDAQALSNSIWALSHLKSRGINLDAIGSPPLTLLDALAQVAAGMLSRLRKRGYHPPHSQAQGGGPNLQECMRFLAANENDFSAQALVNIAYSFATLLEPFCGTHASIRRLFNLMHAETIRRLDATADILRSGALLPSPGGGFNEQALSNAVYAFDRAGMLQPDLLDGVFAVATLRLQRCAATLAGAARGDVVGLSSGGGGGWGNNAPGSGLTFKPQELCTLLKVCHSGLAPPWEFLTELVSLLGAHPAVLDNWTPMEKYELQRAYTLYKQHVQGAALVCARSARPNHQLLGLGAEPDTPRTQQQQQQQQWLHQHLSYSNLAVPLLPYIPQAGVQPPSAGANEPGRSQAACITDMRQLLVASPVLSFGDQSGPHHFGTEDDWWGWSTWPSPVESPIDTSAAYAELEWLRGAHATETGE